MSQESGVRSQESEGFYSDFWILASGFFLVLAYCSLFTVPSLAEDKITIDNTKPITITSDNMEAVKKESLVIFRGNVIAEQKDYILYSKEMYVYYVDSKEIREIVAIGDVKIIQTNKIATGEKAVYTRETRTLVLTGNPQVEQDCDIVKGEKITIFLDEDKSLVEGGSDNRVKAVVSPKDDKAKAKCK